MHPFIEIAGPSNIDTRTEQAVTYFAGPTYGGDGTWQTFNWYESVNGEPEQFVGGGPTYTRTFQYGENSRTTIRLTAQTFGVTIQTQFAVLAAFINCPIGQDTCVE